MKNVVWKFQEGFFKRPNPAARSIPLAFPIFLFHFFWNAKVMSQSQWTSWNRNTDYTWVHV